MVGLDGSEASRRALSWALEEAQRRSCGVEVLTAFSHVPVSPDGLGPGAAARVQAAAGSEMLPRGYDRPVSFQMVEGTPAEVLTRQSERAQLVVIGSHGVAGLRHSAMTPVGELVASMAACPVVVVPPGAHSLPSHDQVAPAAAAVGLTPTTRTRS